MPQLVPFHFINQVELENYLTPLALHKIGLYTYSTSYSHRVFLGNQRSKYTTLNSPSQQLLNSYYITGFADAESTFYLAITKSSGHKLGWRIIPSFSIELHEKDLELLKRIQYFFFLQVLWEYVQGMVK